MKTNNWQLRAGLRSYRVHCKSKPLFTSVQENANSTVNGTIMVWLCGTFLTDSKF